VYDGAVRRADLDTWESNLEGLLARIRPLFYRTESKKHAEQYVRGLLSSIERKNGWTIAEYVGEPEPKALQRFVNSSLAYGKLSLDQKRQIDNTFMQTTIVKTDGSWRSCDIRSGW
jgi:hypothetical protein